MDSSVCPCDFPGKSTGVGCHFLLPGIFQGSNPGLPHCGQTLYHLSHQGSPSNGRYFCSVLQMKRLRLREVKELARGNRAVEHGAWNLKTGSLVPSQASVGTGPALEALCDRKDVPAAGVAPFSVEAPLLASSGTLLLLFSRSVVSDSLRPHGL